MPAVIPDPTSKVVVFSDLCGSTKMKYDKGEKAGIEAVLRHVDIVSGNIAQHGGTLANVMGDGVFCVFPTADDAISFIARVFAVGARSNIDLKVGASLGVVYPHPNRPNDYLGTEVDLAARLCSHAEQNTVLCSEQLKRHLSAEIANGLEFTEVSDLALKGVTSRQSYWLLTFPRFEPILQPHSVVGNGFLSDLEERHNYMVIAKTIVDADDSVLCIGSPYLQYWVQQPRARMRTFLQSTQRVKVRVLLYNGTGAGPNADRAATIASLEQLHADFPGRFDSAVSDSPTQLSYIIYSIQHPSIRSDRWQRAVIGYQMADYAKRPFVEFLYPGTEALPFPAVILENHNRMF